MLRNIGPPTAIKLQQNITNIITNALCQTEYFITENSMSERTSATKDNQIV